MKSTTPADTSMEMKVLGCMIRDVEAMAIASEELEAIDFYDLKHQKIFVALDGMFRRKTNIDFVLLAKELGSQLQGCGGEFYLMEIGQSVVSTSNIRHYIDVLLDKSLRRKLINAGTELIRHSENGKNIDEVVSEHQRVINTATNVNEKALVPIGDAIGETIDILEDRNQRIVSGEVAFNGLATGFTDFDKATGGFGKQWMMLIAARPKQGKSTFGIQMAQQMSHQGKHVLFYSYEMRRSDIVECILSQRTGINFREKITTDGSERLYSKADDMAGENLIINDLGYPIAKLESQVKRYSYTNPVDAVFIDYIQKMPKIPGQSLYESNTETSSRIAQLAKDIDAPVICMAQLNRDIEKRGANMKPKPSDLRETGALEQDASMIVFLHYKPRQEDENSVTDDPPSGPRSIIISRYRFGPSGSVNMYFDKESRCFRPLTNVEFNDFYGTDIYGTNNAEEAF